MGSFSFMDDGHGGRRDSELPCPCPQVRKLARALPARSVPNPPVKVEPFHPCFAVKFAVAFQHLLCWRIAMQIEH